MERETGIEPATSSLGSWRSTAELLPLTVAKSSTGGRGKTIWSFFSSGHPLELAVAPTVRILPGRSCLAVLILFC